MFKYSIKNIKIVDKILNRFGYFKFRKNIGYDILNYIDDKTKEVGIAYYDDQEELAEEIEYKIKNGR